MYICLLVSGIAMTCIIIHVDTHVVDIHVHAHVYTFDVLQATFTILRLYERRPVTCACLSRVCILYTYSICETPCFVHKGVLTHSQCMYGAACILLPIV